jgi:putative molybdopterin biosynthesis protein
MARMSAVIMSEQEQEYTTDEVAARLRIHRLTVIRRIEAGMIPARKEGREWRINKADLEEYIRQSYPKPKEEE